MQMTKRFRGFVVSAAAILIAAIAIPAVAQERVPLKGVLQGQDSHVAFPSDTTVILGSSCRGSGSMLGQFSVTQQTTASLVTLTETGAARWVAANGDSIETTVVGSAEPAESPDYLRVTEIHTITRGTGRFAGAQGSFTVERMHNVVTLVTFGSYHGSITAPGFGK